MDDPITLIGWVTMRHIFKNPMIKSAVGGFIIIGLVYLLGTRAYLGLGIPLIQDSFKEEVSPFAFLWKLILERKSIAKKLDINCLCLSCPRF